MSNERKKIIPFSNPIDRDKEPPLGLLSFNKDSSKKADLQQEAVHVLSMEEKGLNREKRRQEILNYFPDNSPKAAKNVETIINKTTGMDESQLSRLLNYVRLKDFRDSDKFIQVLDEKIEHTWLEDL